MPPPAGVSSPALWGTKGHLDDLFGAGAADIAITRRHFNFRYRSKEHWLDLFREFYGPVLKAFATLDDALQAELTQDLYDLIARFNAAEDGTVVVPSEYLEVVIKRR